MRRLERIDGVVADIDSSVRDHLRSLEEDDSLVYGKIIDVSTIEANEPIDDFSFEEPQLVGESKAALETVIQTGRYTELIAVCVELPSDAVFIDLYTYSGSSITNYPDVGALATSLGVDSSSVHHLVGESVPVARVDNRLHIVEEETYNFEPQVTRVDFAFPLIISALFSTLLGAIGLFTSFSLLPFVIVGVVGGVLMYSILLYFWLATNLEQPVIGLFQSLFVKDYIDESTAAVDTTVISSVENAEVVGFGTFADTPEEESKRTVMYNFYIEVEVMPVGEVKIPVRTPGIRWTNSVGKRAVYEVAPGVDELDRSHGKLLPVTLTNEGHVDIDDERLSDPVNNRTTIHEKFASLYVRAVNNLFGVGNKQTYFDY